MSLLHTGGFFQHEPLQNIYFISFEPVEVDLLVCLWLLLCCIIQLCLHFRWKTNGWIFSFRILWFSFRILGENLFKLAKSDADGFTMQGCYDRMHLSPSARDNFNAWTKLSVLNINFWQGGNKKGHVCMVKSFSSVSGEMHDFVTHCNNMSKLFKHIKTTQWLRTKAIRNKVFYTTFCTNKGYRIKVICQGSSNVFFFFCLSVSLNPLMSF